MVSSVARIGQTVSVRVLVVDDDPMVRRSICSLLSQDPRLEVICETSNGEEAVTKAEEMQPDLILMDVVLPGISGIEAAQRIRRVSRKSQIIFVSQHESEQMARAALRAGGQGYVVKSDAGRELLKAITAVREGQPFVSQRMIDQGWVN